MKLIIDYRDGRDLEYVEFSGNFLDACKQAQEFIYEFSEKESVFCFDLEDDSENLIGYFRPVFDCKKKLKFAFFFE